MTIRETAGVPVLGQTKRGLPLSGSRVIGPFVGQRLGILLRSAVGTSNEEARVEIVCGEAVVCTIVAKVRYESGADGGQYRCVKFEFIEPTEPVSSDDRLQKVEEAILRLEEASGITPK